MFTSLGSRAGRGAAASTLYANAALPIQVPFNSTAVIIDFRNGRSVNFVVGVLTANLTLKFINGRAGGSGFIRLKQDATGNRTLTLNSSAPYMSCITAGGSPTLSTAASSDDDLFYVVESATLVKLALAKAFA